MVGHGDSMLLHDWIKGVALVSQSTKQRMVCQEGRIATCPAKHRI